MEKEKKLKFEENSGFFDDATFIGLVSAEPSFRLVHMLNTTFDFNFVRESDQMLQILKNKIVYQYPYYFFEVPASSEKYYFYQLRIGNISLLPELGKIDYLWMVKSSNFCCHENIIIYGLKKLKIPFIKDIDKGKLTHISNLLI